MAVVPFRCLPVALNQERVVQRHKFKYDDVTAGCPTPTSLHSQALTAWEDENGIINLLVESNSNPSTQVTIGVKLIAAGGKPPENSVYLTSFNVRTQRRGVNMRHLYIA